MNFKTKLLMTVGTVGVAAAVVGGSSYATFNAQTTNPNNTFATGTLVMSNTVNSGTTCFSTSAGSTDTNVNTCDTLFTVPAGAPGGTATTADLTIKNEGSVDASTFQVFTAGCADADTAGSYHGTGSACGQVQLYVQQYSDAARTTPSACLYGGTSAANTCDFSDTTKTLGAFGTAFVTGSRLTIGSGLASGTSTYFRIGVKLPSSADNTVQGRKATIAFTWFMQ